MKVRKAFWAMVLVGAAMLLPLRRAHAGAQYQSTITEDSSNTSSTHLSKPSGADKIVLKPSKKKGDGGFVIQLVAKDISCGSQCQNNVIDLGVHAIGTDVPNAVGILFNVNGGAAVFANGKNKTGTGTLFGSLASSIFNKSLGIGLISLRQSASDPSACSSVPLTPGNHCNDGAIYAVSGFVVPADPTFACTDDNGCGITQVCDPTTNFCSQETCAGDGDCRSGHCNINSGQCCSPGVGAGCP